MHRNPCQGLLGLHPLRRGINTQCSEAAHGGLHCFRSWWFWNQLIDDVLKEITKTTRIQTDFSFKTVHETQVARVLQPNGVYIAVSHGQPSYRLTYLQRPATWLKQISQLRELTNKLTTRPESVVQAIVLCLNRVTRDKRSIIGLIDSFLTCCWRYEAHSERFRNRAFASFSVRNLNFDIFEHCFWKTPSPAQICRRFFLCIICLWRSIAKGIIC